MRHHGLALALSLLLGGPAAAQGVVAATTHRTTSRATSPADAPREPDGGWLFGASVGVPGYQNEMAAELMTVGVHWTQLRPGRVGADFALGTMPRILAEGVGVVGVRAGAALPLELARGVLLLPSAGVSLLGGFGAGGAGGTTGFNAGAAAVLGVTPIALRTGVTWHRFGDAGISPWLFEVGLVRIPQRRR